MPRKKTNPSRIPFHMNEAEARRFLEEETVRMNIYAWAIVLGAVADRRDTTAESLLTFFEAVNGKSPRLRSRRSVEARLSVLEELTGIPFPFHDLHISNLRTQRDVDRLCQKADENAVHSMFALIADVALAYHIMTKEEVCRLFQKAHVLSDELSEGRIILQDLLEVLEQEFGLLLFMEGSSVRLQYAG